MFERIVTSEDSELCKRILSVVLSVYTPITIEVLRVLVNFDHQGCDDSESIRELITECGSFLKVDNDFIFLVHQSAKDFLLDPSTETFEVNKEKEHHKIFSRSLQAFKSLKCDMYKLKNSGTSITDVTRPNPDPLAGIWYSCSYWVDHLEDCQFIANGLEEFEEDKSLDSFLSDDFLHWIEAISLLGSTTEAIASMLKLENLVREHAGPETVLVRVYDACRVFRYYRAVIETHPLQIYTSLIFTPTQSITRNAHYVKAAWILEEPKISTDWDSCFLTLERHLARVESIAWSRNGMLASASLDRTVIWDPATGQRISSCGNGARLIAFSQDDLLASDDASGDGGSNLHVWDLSNRLCELRMEHKTGYMTCISWLRDGRLAFLSKRLIAGIGDCVTGQWTSSNLKRQGKSASCAANSDDGKLAIAFNDYAIQVWDLANDSWITASILKGHSQEVTAMAWSPHGRLASGSHDCTLRMWDPTTSQCVFILKGHNDEVSAVAWSHDERLASGSTDRNIRIWNSVNGQCICVLDGHNAKIKALAFSQDGRLASGSSDGLIKIWDLANAYASLNQEKIESRFKSGGRAEKPQVCEPSTGQTAVSKSHGNDLYSIAWSPNGTQLASASTEITIWDLNSEKSTILDGHRDVVHSMSWSSDGNRLASGSRDQRIIVWDLSSGQKTVLEGHSTSVMFLAWSPLGDLLASKSTSTTRIWSMATGQSIVIEENETRWCPIIWSTNGRRLASWSFDHTFIIWDSTTGRRLCELNIKTDIMRWIGTKSWNLRKEVAVFDAQYKLPPTYMRFLADMRSSALSIGYSIEMSDDWICFEGQKLLWLPPEYRPVRSDSFILGDKTRLAFGCSAGHIWTITLSANGLVGESITREIDSDTSGARTE
ncbi:hypothetical protein PMG11_07767 [Penicillium brasilianum]|uniref:Uncharacterized protein n=1 Tax=Penicillium brasilianum TaxID=104259 RepID=A0A0F7TVM9_PENBI|nr:hypothetical protein PMG11_07767 [Penicillium brasilianum]